ncbi:TlyA family RNA methyltransferase [Aestuariimicrobium soli]|uniref:TlyA family RNA methyltransferase n=1 Tax=Aestuariimicrobium soli TaxID=2035834 RepID=UPI003EC0CE09
MRIDQLIAARGLARSRSAAQHLIRAGRVSLNGQPVTRPGVEVPDDVTDLVVDTDPWVGRAAHKLIGALDEFGVTPGPVVLDAGASTGGFTQVCLARGAERVHAVDVGHGQLADEVRRDPRVVVREGFNLRDLRPDTLGEPVDLVVCDVSFISVTLLAEPLLSVLHPGGQALVLVKPQFEVGRRGLDHRGVVKDPRAAADAVAQVGDLVRSLGWRVSDPFASPLTGENGNQEFWLRWSHDSHSSGEETT